MLSVESSPTNIYDHAIFQINSVNVSIAVNVVVGEWSHSMFAAVSQLLKHYQTPHGILKKQEKVHTNSNENNKNSSLSLINRLCVLREDLEEFDISFNSLDINLFLYNNTPSDPSVLLRIDKCCVKTLEIHSGKIEDLVLVVHCSNFILLPFSVEHVIEVRVYCK